MKAISAVLLALVLGVGCGESAEEKAAKAKAAAADAKVIEATKKPRKIMDCFNCGGIVAPSAISCPHCGSTDFTGIKAKAEEKRLWIIRHLPTMIRAIKVHPGSLTIHTGDTGQIVFKGSVHNGGKESVRNIKITLQFAVERVEWRVTHTVNKEVKPGQTFEFTGQISEPRVDLPENTEITVHAVDLDPDDYWPRP